MSEQLLTILRFALLALLYLFFLRVLRAVWAEIRGPRVSSRRQQAAAVAQRGRMFPLGQELTVGRAAGCQVTLDDTYVSQLHARVFARDGQYLVEDLGSTNGTFVGEERIHDFALENQSEFTIGGSTLMLIVTPKS